jgi:hypothetical protein
MSMQAASRLLWALLVVLFIGYVQWVEGQYLTDQQKKGNDLSAPWHFIA